MTLTATPSPTPPKSTSYEKAATVFTAPCEVCGADCDWSIRDSVGLCPCVGEEAA